MRSLMAVGAIGLIGLFGTACGAESGDSTIATPTTTMAESSSDQTAREVAPRLTGTTLQGEAIGLDQFRGRPVMINVWSSW
jgi:hypothetical protein